jgi:NitT/TauT family transport system permease protein
MSVSTTDVRDGAVPIADAGRPSPARREPRASIWERIPRAVSTSAFALLLVLGWQIAIWLEVTSEFVLPRPLDVARETISILEEMVSGGYALDSFWITAQEVLLGFVVAAIAGIGFGVLVAETAFGRIVVLPFLVASNAAPKVALAPIFVAWLGFGISAKVALAAFIAFFPLLIDTAAGLAGVDQERTKLFRMVRASRFTTFTKLKLPTALPFIFAGLKTAAVLSVVGAIVGEFLGGGAGFGELIRVAGSQLSMDRVFAFVLILSAAGYAFFLLIAWLERRVIFWRSTELFGDPHGV